MTIKHVAYAILGTYALMVADFSEGAQPDFMNLSLIGTMDDKNLIAESKQASSSVVRIIDNMYNIVSTTQENKVQKCCCFIATFYYGALISAGQIIKKDYKKEKLDERDLTELKAFVELTRNVSKNFSELAREMHDAYSTGIYRNCKSFNNTLDKALGFEFYEEKRTFNAMLQACDPYAPEENFYDDLTWYAGELSAKANEYLENSGIAKRENVINTLRFIDSKKATETVSVVRYDVMCQKLEEERDNAEEKFKKELRKAEKAEDKMMEAIKRLEKSEAEREKQAKLIEDQKEELKKIEIEIEEIEKSEEEKKERTNELEKLIDEIKQLKENSAKESENTIKNQQKLLEKQKDKIYFLQTRAKAGNLLLTAFSGGRLEFLSTSEDVVDSFSVLQSLIQLYREVVDADKDLDTLMKYAQESVDLSKEANINRLNFCKWIIGEFCQKGVRLSPLKALHNFIDSEDYNVSFIASRFACLLLSLPLSSDKLNDTAIAIEKAWEKTCNADTLEQYWKISDMIADLENYSSSEKVRQRERME